MAIDTGDLTPRASGAASLGVEQIGLCGFTADIRPFCHLHITSGVWHDPVQGQSGVIRFSVAHNAFEVSVDGGLTFDLLPASGQIDTFVDLQEAYDNGNEIDQTSKAAGPPLSAANFFVEHDPVVVRQTIPGAGLPDAHGILNGIRDASIVASGFTLTPNLLSTFAHTSIGPGYVTMQGSGSIAAPEDAGTLTFAATNSSILGPVAIMAASGLFIISAEGGTIWNQNGNGELVFQNLGPQDGTGLGGQVRIEAFAASGRLQYRLGGVGGHEAWHWRPSYEAVGGPNSDGFHPLPHSGQILQMILENGGGGGTLQQAYNAGQRIDTSAAEGGPVHINGGTDSYGLRLDQDEGGTIHPHMLVSGIIGAVTSNQLAGSLWLQGHTGGNGNVQFLGGGAPATRAEASAKSLGFDNLFYNTGGSGITMLRPASGVSQFFNISAGPTIDETGDKVPINIQTTPSTFYHVTNASGIQIFVPGLYRIQYSAIIEKTTGNLAQGVTAEIRLRDKWGREFSYLGSQASAILRDSNNLNENSCVGQTVTDLKPGDSIVLYVYHNGVPPAANTVRAKSGSSNVIVEWLGPLSGGSLTAQEV